MGDSGGREGDWACAGCGNRNYAFRSLCNRCKQPRLLVDTRTPADSKWLPRVGDWICSGCTNNNYASRDKCKKCGQPKEIAAMAAAIAMAGGTNYFVRAPQGGLLDQRLLAANGGLMNHMLPLNLGSNWPMNVFPFSSNNNNNNNWGLGGGGGGGGGVGGRNLSSGLLPPFASQSNLAGHKGWRNGDWICICGFHNYSSRAQCKKCNASMPPALGMKRLASEEIGLDNKRLNAGQMLDQVDADNSLGIQPDPLFPMGRAMLGSNSPAGLQFPNVAVNAAFFGKGGKQWRDGDWMCSNCNNHNYASRTECNRCKTHKDNQLSDSVTVVG